MYSTQDVLDVTKSAIAQLIGYGYMDSDYELTALDSSSIVDLGEKIGIGDSIDKDSKTDIFFKSLLNQIGKVVVDSRQYVAELPHLYVDVINWGLFTEMVTIELSDVMIDEMWNPNGFINWNEPAGTNPVTLSGEQEGSRIASIEFGCYKPPVSATIYKQCHGIMVGLTIAREQMFTAFRGETEYNSFVAGLFNSVHNTIQAKAEVYALMCVSMGIAKSKGNGNEINLLAEYNSLTGSELKAINAHENDNYNRFCLKRISDIKHNIRRFNALYNNHEHVTFSSTPQTILLNQFANSVKFGVRANTYNEHLLGIGEYDTVTAWQSATSTDDSDKYSFTNASSIMLSKKAYEKAGLTNGTITGVIGVLYDRMSMGICLDKKKTTSQYSASRDTTNYFYHSLVNYTVNDNYPIVTFVTRDVEDT